MSRDVVVLPEKVGTARCTIGKKYHMFDKQFGDAPCTNCGRDYCREHTSTRVESALTPGLCTECGEAYQEDGADGLRRVRNRIFRLYGS